jgi:glycosyltransferase involved in cell wall biosynthesis
LDLSIIIAHYDPGNHPNCVASFKKTLESISSQKNDYNIEIIIADDGSINNNTIQTLQTQTILQNGRHVHLLENSSLNEFLESRSMNESQISKWLYLPKDIQCMAKARLLNVATSIAKSENLFFLDDDNYFISEESIDKIINLLKKYTLIFGQIQDSNGHLRTYSSNRVQGTTFGIKKSALIASGGFGEWTEEVSSGVDSDLWWKLYHYFQKNTTLKACYTTDIQTIDSCSKRWRPFIKSFFRKRKLIRAFDKEHQCPNYNKIKFNPSRNKKNWLINLS